jgi:hypothetical protein
VAVEKLDLARIPGIERVLMEGRAAVQAPWFLGRVNYPTWYECASGRHSSSVVPVAARILMRVLSYIDFKDDLLLHSQFSHSILFDAWSLGPTICCTPIL